MTRAPKSRRRVRSIRPTAADAPLESAFDEVLQLIETSRSRAFAAANTELVKLYWSVGEYISRRIARDGWGKGTVEALAQYIRARRPGALGYSARNLWRMNQFYEVYRDSPKLSPLVTELDWTKNLLILSRCKRDEEREFYLRLCHRENWGKRELERQLSGALFKRTILSDRKLLQAKLHEFYALAESRAESQARLPGLSGRTAPAQRPEAPSRKRRR